VGSESLSIEDSSSAGKVPPIVSGLEVSSFSIAERSLHGGSLWRAVDIGQLFTQGKRIARRKRKKEEEEEV